MRRYLRRTPVVPMRLPYLLFLLSLLGGAVVARAQPANQDCSGAATICAGTPLAGNNTGANLWPPFCTTPATDHLVWFTFTTNSQGGAVDVDVTDITCPPQAGMDNELSAVVFSGDGNCTPNAFVAVGDCQHDSADFTLTTNPLLPNTQYWVVVSGVLDNGATLPAECAFNISTSGPGADIIGVQGLYSKQDLEHMETATRGISRGVVIGGGLIGIEVAEMLHSRHIPVTMVVRESSYWNSVLPPEESLMINRHIRHQGIDLRLETELQDIQTDDNRHVQSVRTNKSDVIPAEFVALTIGVRPNIGLATASSIPTNRGICVNEWFETSLPDVYAIGDCAEILDTGSSAGRVEQLWYTAEMHGETVARTICGERTRYERGIFFNSAKFFDIEYQTYGQVNAHVPGEQSLFYEHPDHRRSIRIVYTSEHVIGFNLLGIRYRHAVCEEWIAQKRSIDYVLEHIEQANFDPEFFERFEPALLAAYRQQTGREIHLKKQRSFFGFKQFLRSVSSS